MRARSLVAMLLTIAVASSCGPDPDDRPGADGGLWSMAETDRSDDYEVTNWSSTAFEASGMAFLPDGRSLVITKGGWGGPGIGRVELLEPNGQFVRTVLELPVCSDAERGLMNIAIDPDFERTSLIYLYFTRDMSGCAVTEPAMIKARPAEQPVWNRMSTFVFDENGIDPSTERVVLDEMPGHQGSHNSGSMVFLDDGTMLVTVGEAGYGWSRQLTHPTGKVLRIDPSDPTRVLPDNPYAASSTSLVTQRVWASGIRNMFHLALDDASGLVVGSDVGTATYEEINVIVRGADYGYKTTEGPGGADGTAEPVMWYQHGTGCAAIIGGDFVGRDFVDGAPGTSLYTFSDFGCGGIWALSFDRDRPIQLFRLAPKMEVSPSALVSGPDGAVYLVGVGPGAQPIRRLAPRD